MGDKTSTGTKIMGRIDALEKKLVDSIQILNNNQEKLSNEMEHVKTKISLLEQRENASNDSILKQITKDIQHLTELQNTQNMEIQSSVSDIQTAVNNLFKASNAKAPKAVVVAAAADNVDATPAAAATDATPAADAAEEKKTPAKRTANTAKAMETFFKKAYREKHEKVSALISADMLRECVESEEVKKAKNGAPKKQAEAKWLWENKFKEGDLRKALEAASV